MLSSSSLKSSFLIISAFVAGSLISIATTVALAHGGDTSKLHACVDDTTGAVRMVGENDTCPSGETNVDWDKSATDSANVKQPFTCYVCQFDSFYESTFKGKDLTGIYVGRTTFSNIDLTGTIFKHGTFYQSAGWNSVNFTNADFSEASISHVSINLSNLTNTNFSNASISQITTDSGSPADFTNANFTNAIFENDNLTGATNMDTATFTGATWDNVTCPDGTNSDENSNTCIGHLTP